MKRKRLSCFSTILSTLGMLGVLLLSLNTGTAQAVPFVSGSTCSPAFYNSSTCRGAFSPTVNTVITLPPSGVLDYTTFNVPANVTVSFQKNAANTPVYIRTSSDVTINGYISVSAVSAATNSGTAGDGNLGDDGRPGLGGPGGFNGGMGGLSPLFGGSTGMSGGAGGGPGGGFPGAYYGSNLGSNGGGGSFGTAGNTYNGGAAGSTYGQANLLPLIGGSGGGGGGAGASFNGSGGGGGGGAITIASSGTITLGSAGYVIADGSTGGSTQGTNCGGAGGGGSGGAIRLVAEKLVRVGNGYLYARGASGGSNPSLGSSMNGGAGIIRAEANTLQNWVNSNSDPYNTFSTPGKVFVPNNPTLTITSITATVAGVPTDFPAPDNPTGSADITLAAGTTTAKVNVAASYIPIGTTVTIQVIPAMGASKTTALTGALSGASDAATTASANVTLSSGNNMLLATATYTVTEIIAGLLPRFDGEYVAKIRVESEMGGGSKVVYITSSGREYTPNGVQLNPLS